MSLRRKVNVGVSLLLLIAVLSSAALLVVNARKSVHGEVGGAMKSAAHLLTVMLGSEHLNNNQSLYTHMQQVVPAISQLRSLHILMFGSQGLLFEGEPKQREAMAPAWFTRLIMPELRPLTQRFSTGHMVIYGEPQQEIDQRWRDVRGLLLVGFLMLMLVSALLYWGLGRVTRPLDIILQGLSSVEKGDFDLRLPPFNLEEMDKIGQAFNQMGQSLAESTDENRQMAMLVRQSHEAILSVDFAGKIDFCNPATVHLFDRSADALYGKSLAEIGLADGAKDIAWQLAMDKDIANVEIGLAANAEITLLFSAVPLRNQAGEVTGKVCTLRDVSEQKLAELAAQSLYETRLLTQHMSEMQERERRYLAQELHDELGQCLTAIKTDAVLISKRSQQTDKKTHTSARAIIDVASHIYDVVHNMITRLRPSPLDDLGLIATLEQGIASWRQRQPQIYFSLRLAGELDTLSEALNMTVFRIVQEAITNAVRHANAQEIKIDLQRKTDGNSDCVMLVIADNGKGMVVEDFHSEVDFGLLGMRERVQSLAGEFTIDSAPNAGFRISIMIPLAE